MTGDATQQVSFDLPAGLTSCQEAYPTVFVDSGRLDLRGRKARTVEKINDALFDALRIVAPSVQAEQALLKVHVGERRCKTRMRPEYAEGSVRFLRDQDVPGVVAGDTTVAYSGPRGYRQNPANAPRAYLDLASRQGWSAEGPTGIPFVVLDRPSTAISGAYTFSEEEVQVQCDGAGGKFNDFFLAGGFAAADFVVNHAHLTLHGLAGVSGCVKSVAMGCSSLKGKLRMHQSLLPRFDSQVCVACGLCVEHCPEGALDLPDDATEPHVDCELCIGCGECEAVCAQRAVELRAETITDWQRGEHTLPVRMADYTMGLMDGRWDNTVHVLHMVTVTERCDCLDVRQKPMLGRDLGFLVGKNPFAMDSLAARRLAEALPPGRRDPMASFLRAAESIAHHVHELYGILAETPVERIVL